MTRNPLIRDALKDLAFKAARSGRDPSGDSIHEHALDAAFMNGARGLVEAFLEIAEPQEPENKQKDFEDE